MEWVTIAPNIGRQLYGEPTLIDGEKLAWSRSGRTTSGGSIQLQLRGQYAGMWADWANNVHTNTIGWLIAERLASDVPSAYQWLRDNGFIGETDMPINRTPAKRKREPKDHLLPKIMQQCEIIPRSPKHPAQLWRPLLRDGFALPSNLRWIPASAPFFWGKHAGAGAIVVPIAPLLNWMTPSIKVRAAQLINIKSDGSPVDDGLRKVSYGKARGGFYSPNLPTKKYWLMLCEGAADALAWAYMHPNHPIAATMTTPSAAHADSIFEAGFGEVAVFSDRDSTGIKSIYKFKNRLENYGIDCYPTLPTWGKDLAECKEWLATHIASDAYDK